MILPIASSYVSLPEGITSYNQNAWDPDKHEAQQRSTEGVRLHIGHEAQESTEKLAEHQVGLGEQHPRWLGIAQTGMTWDDW